MLRLIQQKAINNNPLLLSCQWCNFLFYIFAFPSLFLRADRHWNLQYDFSIPAHTVARGLHSSPAVAGQSVTPVTHHAQWPRLPPASTPSLLCCIPLSGLELSAATIGFFLHHKTSGMARLGSLCTILPKEVIDNSQTAVVNRCPSTQALLFMYCVHVRQANDNSMTAWKQFLCPNISHQ